MSLSIQQDAAHTCCSSQTFAQLLCQRNPFSSLEHLISSARQIWWQELGVQEWLDAFAAHPIIGDVEGLKKKYGTFNDLSKGEQSTALQSVDESVFQVTSANAVCWCAAEMMLFTMQLLLHVKFGCKKDGNCLRSPTSL